MPAVGCAVLQGGGFKSQREQQRKADAGNRAAWNSLFMRADTVAEAVAAHYGISKAQLLDAEAADLPVRMALGEAQVGGQPWLGPRASCTSLCVHVAAPSTYIMLPSHTVCKPTQHPACV
jgi:hypothetical protein